MKDFILTITQVWAVTLVLGFVITVVLSWLIPDERDEY